MAEAKRESWDMQERRRVRRGNEWRDRTMENRAAMREIRRFQDTLCSRRASERERERELIIPRKKEREDRGGTSLHFSGKGKRRNGKRETNKPEENRGEGVRRNPVGHLGLMPRDTGVA